MATAGVVAVVTWWLSRSRDGEVPLVALVPRQLTSDPGREGEPALSRDGTLVAFVSDHAGHPDVWVVDVKGGEPLQLTNDIASDAAPAWFPDGSAVAFESDRGGRPEVWKVPRLGGAAVLLMPDAASPRISPDGRLMAFARADQSNYTRIAVAEIGRPETVRLLTGERDGLWSHGQPAWSPDGRTIAYADFRDIWLVPASGGPARALTTDHAVNSTPSFSADGRFVYFASEREGTSALWRTAVDGGTPRRVTTGTGPEAEPSCAATGPIAFSTAVDRFDVAIADLRTGTRTRFGGVRAETGPSFAPDASAIVFSSDRDVSYDLWVQGLSGGSPSGRARRLTEQRGNESLPAWSPDGRRIAYSNADGAERDIWVIPAAGGLAFRVTSGPGGDLTPSWSPDGQRLAFVSSRSDGDYVWVVRVGEEGALGEPVRLTSGDGADYFPKWSPDGATIAFHREEHGGSEIWTVPADGSAPARPVSHGAEAAFLAWFPDGDALLVWGSWREGRQSFRRLFPRTGGLERPSPALPVGDSIRLGPFDISRDGRFLAYSEGEHRGDVWLLEPAGVPARR